jgi:hypothetical protein
MNPQMEKISSVDADAPETYMDLPVYQRLKWNDHTTDLRRALSWDTNGSYTPQIIQWLSNYGYLRQDVDAAGTPTYQIPTAIVSGLTKVVGATDAEGKPKVTDDPQNPQPYVNRIGDAVMHELIVFHHSESGLPLLLKKQGNRDAVMALDIAEKVVQKLALENSKLVAELKAANEDSAVRAGIDLAEYIQTTLGVTKESAVETLKAVMFAQDIDLAIQGKILNIVQPLEEQAA